MEKDPSEELDNKPGDQLHEFNGIVERASERANSISARHRNLPQPLGQNALDATLIEDNHLSDELIVFSRKVSIALAAYMTVFMLTAHAFGHFAHNPYAAPQWAVLFVGAVFGGASTNTVRKVIEHLKKKRK